MAVFGEFFKFFNNTFTILGFNISLFQVIVFGGISSIVGYVIGTFFRR